MVYCHIYERRGDSFFGWKSKYEECTPVYPNNKSRWEYDLSNLEKSKNISGGMQEGKDYLISICTDNDIYSTAFLMNPETNVTNILSLSPTSYTIGGKRCFTGGGRYYEHLFLDDEGYLRGAKLCPNETPEELLGEWLMNYYVMNDESRGKCLRGIQNVFWKFNMWEQYYGSTVIEYLNSQYPEKDFSHIEMLLQEAFNMAFIAEPEMMKFANIGTRADVRDVVATDDEAQTLYFYMPTDWKNEYNDCYKNNIASCAAGIYWGEGRHNCKEFYGKEYAWPGYNINEREEYYNNVYAARVPVDVKEIVFNNTVTDEHKDAAKKTLPIKLGGYKPGEDGYGFYPDGIKSFNNMIYVLDSRTGGGAWFYYYGSGQYGIFPTRAEARAKDSVFSGGKFPRIVTNEPLAEPEIQNIRDAIPSDTETMTIRFYAPESFNGNVGVFWLEGDFGYESLKTEQEKENFFGYKVSDTESFDKNIFVAKIPQNARALCFHNLIKGTSKTLMTDMCTPYDNTIFVVDPNRMMDFESTSLYGDFFYYYGDGKYGVYPSYEDAVINGAVRSGGEFPSDPYYYDENNNWRITPGSLNYPTEPEPTLPINPIPTAPSDPIFNIEYDTFYYLPSAEQALKAYKYGIKFSNDNGEGTEQCYMMPSDKIVNGIRAYKINVGLHNMQSVLKEFNNMSFTIFDGDKLVGEVKVADISQAKDNIITSDGTLYKAAEPKEIITKKANPVKVTAKTKTVKAKKLKKGKLTVKALTVKNAKGKVSYKKLSSSKKLTLTKKGKITVKKGTKKGIYKIKVKITAKGNSKYLAKSVTKTVKIKVK